MLRLAQAAGWNQTEKDLAVFFEGQNNVNLAAEIDERLVGTVASASYNQKVAWISMMIVEEKYRGRGVGKRLMQAIIKKLKERGVKTIKLDATPAGKLVYVKLGFKEEYEIHRLIHSSPVDFFEKNSPLAATLESKDLERIIELDHTVFGARRDQLFRALVNSFPHKAFALKERDQIKAFALGREGRQFDQIGPLTANNLKEAQSLISAVLAKQSGRAIIVDVLADKTALISWFHSLGFHYQRSLYRMFLAQNTSPGEKSRQYLICGPEFG